MRAASIEPDRFTVLERGAQVALGALVVALFHQDESEVVLGPGQIAAVFGHRQQTERAVSVSGGLGQVSGLLVGDAEVVVHVRHAGQVAKRARGVEGELEAADRLAELPPQDVHAAQVTQDPDFEPGGPRL